MPKEPPYTLATLLLWDRIIDLEEKLKRAQGALSFAREKAPSEIPFQEWTVSNIEGMIKELQSAIMELGGSLNDRPTVNIDTLINA